MGDKKQKPHNPVPQPRPPQKKDRAEKKGPKPKN